LIDMTNVDTSAGCTQRVNLCRLKRWLRRMFAASRAGADCFQVWRGTFRFYGMSNVGLQTFSGEYCECSQSGLGETDKLLQESSRRVLDRVIVGEKACRGITKSSCRLLRLRLIGLLRRRPRRGARLSRNSCGL